VSTSPKPDQLRNAIAQVLWNPSALETEQICDALGMPPQPEGAPDPMASKVGYVRRRLIPCDLDQLLEIARRVEDEYGDGELEQYLSAVGVTGIEGELKNLIFAADGPKPRIVLRDAVNNVIEIVKNAEHCLVFDRPLGPEGLTWQALVDWWRARQGSSDEREAARNLYERLQRSLGDNDPEKLVLRTYAERYRPDGGFQIPALVPQVYLHYDPYTKAELGPEGQVLGRQRMDFLMLFPDQSRVVIEIDGRQHYGSGQNNEKTDPVRYAEMVLEDRALRLRGYEVYRFGGAEFVGGNTVQVLNDFFDALLARHA
jgi:very-short-patch-repair endonuclease